jgi:hypothetical protein
MEARMRWMWMAVLVIVLLALPATSATSAGFSLSWGDACWSDVGAASNLTWACDSDTYNGIRMTCSFELDAGMPDFAGVAVFLEGMTEGSVLPDWWKLGALGSGDCREGLIGLTGEKPFSSACVSPWQGEQLGGIGLYSWDSWADGRMHVNGAWAMAEPVPLEANVEYFACQLRISAARTVGGCAGCSVPAIWAISRMQLTRVSANLSMDSPYHDGNQCITWQSSTSSCGQPIPVRNATWGQLKSLYR